MGRVIADITMSLDGFVTGPRPDLEHGLGEGGEPLHAWAFSGTDVDTAVLAETTAATGAVVMGRRTFDIIDGPHGWNDEVGYGAGPEPAPPPVLVVTHQPPATVRLGPRFDFVTDGIGSAIARARAVAGDRDVVVMGGADVVRQCVELGLADELRLHLAPLLLRDGTALFAAGRRGPLELEQFDVRVSPFATHLTYRVRAGASATG